MFRLSVPLHLVTNIVIKLLHVVTKTQLNINVDMTDSSTVAVAMFSAMELKAKQREAKYLRYFRVFCSSIG